MLLHQLFTIIAYVAVVSTFMFFGTTAIGGLITPKSTGDDTSSAYFHFLKLVFFVMVVTVPMTFAAALSGTIL